MAGIPVKVKERITANIKKFQPIVKSARDKDINDSDTVTIVSDMLSDLFGYEKYRESTSEFSINKTYCDLAIKLDGEPRMLIEVKAAGLDLKDQHVKQAVDYGSNAGVDWVILTNAYTWKVFKVIFAKPVYAELIFEFELPTLNMRREDDMNFIYYLSREAMSKNNHLSLDAYHAQKQLLNKYVISQILLSPNLIDAIRKTMKHISSDTKVDNDEIKSILIDEVIKRDVLDGEKAVDAKKLVAKANKPKETKPKIETTDIPIA